MLKNKKESKELLLWKFLSNLWGGITAIFFALTFFQVTDLSYLLTDVTIIYVSILSIFTGLKEYNRWHNKHFASRYHGEIFVATWTLLIITFIVLSAVDKNNFKISTEFTATYLSVLGIYAISRKSKHLKLR